MSILPCSFGSSISRKTFVRMIIAMNLKGHSARENHMLAKIHIVAPIVKQVVPFSKIIFLSSIALLKRKLRLIAGEQRIHIFVIFLPWSLASLDGFVVRRWLY